MGAFNAGDTFLMAGLGQKMHLFVVICDPAGVPLTILAVPLNTLTSRSDTTLVLGPGDHPFIKHQTSVSFDLLIAVEVDKLSQLEALCAAGQATSFERRSAVSPDLLNRILKGALQSDLTPKGMVRTLKERLGINSVEDLQRWTHALNATRSAK